MEGRKRMALLWRFLGPLVIGPLVGAMAVPASAGAQTPEAAGEAAEYDSGGAGAAPALDVTTPPPEAGAVEFDAAGTGLIRTEVFGQDGAAGSADTDRPTLQLDAPYGGIVPGRRDELPRFRRFRRSKRPWVTWIGFQPLGGGRVFLQVTKRVAFNFVQVSDQEIHVDLQGARLAFPNTQRRLDMSKFPGAFEVVQARNMPGMGVRVIVRLRRPGRPVVRQQSGYVFIEVP